jgi:hypothetical protein
MAGFLSERAQVEKGLGALGGGDTQPTTGRLEGSRVKVLSEKGRREGQKRRAGEAEEGGEQGQWGANEPCSVLGTLRTSPRVWTGKAGLEEASSPKWQELMPLTSQSPA